MMIGPALFKPLFRKEVFDHFCLLHFALSIFADEKLFHHLHLAEKCIELFVHRAKKVLGRRSLTYNMHVILHLGEFVRKIGQLRTVSACYL
jgi:hypothetical protein